MVGEEDERVECGERMVKAGVEVDRSPCMLAPTMRCAKRYNFKELLTALHAFHKTSKIISMTR